MSVALERVKDQDGTAIRNRARERAWSVTQKSVIRFPDRAVAAEWSLLVIGALRAPRRRHPLRLFTHVDFIN